MSADDEYDEEIPDEEKLAIATHFLLSSPAGEVLDVLEDVKATVPAHLLTDSVLASIFRKHNTEQFQVVKCGDSQVVLCKDGEVDESHYIDTHGGRVVGVDHVTQTCVAGDARPLAGEMDAALEDTRAAIEAHVDGYLSTQYGEGAGVCSVFAKGGKLVVVVAGQKINQRNFWSGKWNGHWTVNPGDKQITGSLKIAVHYYEDGNVQMTSEKVFEKQAVPGDLAEGVVAVIKEQETAVQASLEEMYINMAQETFKDMRRILPISKQKMDWSGQEMALAQGFSK